MSKKMDENETKDKGEQAMSVAANAERPCTISESIIQACKEVKGMREGQAPKRSLNELFANIEKWNKEEE